MKTLISLLLLTYSFCATGQIGTVPKSDNLIRIESNLGKIKNDLDSLDRAVRFIKEHDYKSFEVVNSVSSYYENAWVKLLYLITILGAITGILLPVYLSRLQTKELKLNKEEFKDYVDSQVLLLEKRILEFNKQEIITTKSEINLETQKKIDQLYGMTFHIQGLHFLSGNKYQFALKNFVASVKYQLKSSDLKNLHNTLITTKISLQKLNEQNEKIEARTLVNIKRMIKELEASPNEVTMLTLNEIKKYL